MDGDPRKGAQTMKVIVLDENGLEAELKRLTELEMEAITKKSLTQMLNRARDPGGTPVDTGELRLSSAISMDEMGYEKEYAAHVEYGHRTRGGGWVAGQYFLKRNVEAQSPIFEEDVLNMIRKA